MVPGWEFLMSMSISPLLVLRNDSMVSRLLVPVSLTLSEKLVGTSILYWKFGKVGKMKLVRNRSSVERNEMQEYCMSCSKLQTLEKQVYLYNY